MSEISLKNLDKYSYSKISTYKQCRFKYYLKYDQKNFLYSANIATEFGSLVHETEEAIAIALQAGQPINYIDLKNHFIIEVRKLALKYPAEFFTRDKSNRTYQEKSYLYLDSAIYRLEKFMLAHPSYKIIGIEQKFEYNYDNIHSFNGSIDRAFFDEANRKFIIQDIKTWSVAASSSDLRAPLQFAVYTMAAQDLWGADINDIRCEYDLPLCDLIQPALSNDIVSEGKVSLDKLFKGIAKNDFKPTISALCHWCEYNPLTNPTILDTKPNAICPYFSTWQKSGDAVRDTLITWQGLENVEIDRQFCISQIKQQLLQTTRDTVQI